MIYLVDVDLRIISIGHLLMKSNGFEKNSNASVLKSAKDAIYMCLGMESKNHDNV